MKKLLFILMAMIIGLGAHAQKKSGTVYSEHEIIDKAKLFWTSVLDDNLETLKSITADSVYLNNNGNPGTIKNENWGTWITYWNGFEDTKVEDDGAAYPDAIEYDGGVTWVQDWLRITGIHKETGINVDLHIHNLYNFNEDGKIAYLASYYNNNVFEKIADNLTPSENGTIYMNHSYVTSVRKLINAYRELNIDKWETFFAPNARFSNTTMKPKEFNGIEKQREELIKAFANTKEIRLEPVGYPDCLHYNKEDNWCVLSWWNVYGITNDGNKFEYPLQYQHWFNKDGKISSETMYFSSNHFE